MLEITEIGEIDKDYAFYLSSDLKEYAGKWIATVDGRIARFMVAGVLWSGAGGFDLCQAMTAFFLC